MLTRYKHRGRFREIIGILIKHGFDYFAEQLGIAKPIIWQKKLTTKSAKTSLSLPERVRRLFEDLGPAFIKMGQILSTRPDLVPKEFVEELRKLQDHVDRFPGQEVDEQVLKSLGALPNEIFLHFDYKPLACASIGQVHRALLVTGEEVVVKIQRPRIKELAEKDLAILKRMKGPLQTRTALGRVCDIDEIIQVFERQMHRELDYTIEGLNIDSFRRIYKDVDFVHVPEVYWQHTTNEVLTMEYLEGKRLEEINLEILDKETREKLACNMVYTVFYPFYKDGTFHADPHPGNILIREDHSISLIDFGMIGRLDPDFRHRAANLMLALWNKDVTEVMELAKQTGKQTKAINDQIFFEDMAELVDKVSGVIVGEIPFGQIIEGMITISIKHGIKMPGSYFLLVKTLVTIEGLARNVSPSFNMLKVTKPLAIEYLQKEVSIDVSPEAMYKNAAFLKKVFTELPEDLCDTVRQVAKGDLRVIFYHRNLKWLDEVLELTSSRISFSVIVASLMVASALIILSGYGPYLWGYPMLGIVGFLFASALGGWMAINLLRKLS